MQQAEGARTKDRPPLAGDVEAVPHVGPRLGFREGLQVIAGGHALRQLAQVVPRQDAAQLGLADEDDLQQLLARRLQIGQQANLLEHLAAEILGLVDDQHRAPPARVRVEQVAVERVDERLEAGGAGGVRDVQLVAHGGQQLDRRERGVEDHRHVDLGR